MWIRTLRLAAANSIGANRELLGLATGPSAGEQSRARSSGAAATAVLTPGSVTGHQTARCFFVFFSLVALLPYKAAPDSAYSGFTNVTLPAPPLERVCEVGRKEVVFSLDPTLLNQ